MYEQRGREEIIIQTRDAVKIWRPRVYSVQLKRVPKKTPLCFRA